MARCAAARPLSSRVVCVSGAVRLSGRCRARRRSKSAAWSSAPIRSRAAGESSAMLLNTSWMPNRRWITDSWTSRARSMRSCSWRAWACLFVAWRAKAASAAVLPSVHSRWRSGSRSGGRSGPRSERITPSQRPAAAIGVHTSVDSWIRLRNSSGTPSAIALEISITRSSSSDSRATGTVSTVTWASAKTSRGMPKLPAAREAQARAVVAEDHGAVHVGHQAGGLAQAAVEGVASTDRPRRGRAVRRTSRARRC